MNKRIFAVLAAVYLVVSAANAADADLGFSIGRCATLADDKARLACYDDIAAQLKAAGSQSAATAQSAPAQAAAAQPPAQTASQAQKEESWFGFVGSWFGGSTPPTKQTTPAQFGSESIAPPPVPPGATAEPGPLDHISSGVTEVAFNYFGRFTVFLDNGQVWKQLEADTGSAPFSRHQKDTVTISRGLLGSYNLVINGHTAMFKVKRIK
jgi:hypothetical protein